MNPSKNSTIIGKPFLKWAGGKSQLINFLQNTLPKNFDVFDTYIEPFVGGGAFTFFILTNYPNLKKIVINDINTDLISAYVTIKNQPVELIKALLTLQEEYLALSNEQRKDYFLSKRELFNKKTNSTIDNTALLIFLNRTCFNGLYRVNSKNQFNVPFGKYVNPKICDERTILHNSILMQKVTILNNDYSEIKKHIEGKTFVYFDPPYKPISKTSSFNSYNSNVFNDNEQIRLCNFCKDLNNIGVFWLLSNSDPKNTEANNGFFDDLYEDFIIKRIPAKRLINSKVGNRSEINELLISNYE